MNIVIVGDSHVVALQEAWSSIADRETLFPNFSGRLSIGMLAFGAQFLKPFHTLDGDVLKFTNPQMAEQFTKLTGDSEAAIRRGDERSFAFSLGFHGVALFNYKMWERFTVSPSMPQKQYVSRAALREMILSLNAQILNFYQDLQSLGVRFTAISAPPLPKTYLDGKFHPHYEAQEIADLRRSYVDLFAGIMTEKGLAFIPPPDGVMKDGYLLDHLSAQRQIGDFHANAQYGALLLPKILSECW